MFRQTVFYLLVFIFTACFGYTKLSKYPEYQKKSVGGAVFQLAPDEEVKIKGVLGEQTIMFSVRFKLGKRDMFQSGDARMVCVKFPTSNRLNIRVFRHGYFADEIELDEFVVTECNQYSQENMFNVSTIGTNKYSLAFKDKRNKCFKREIEMIEGELTLTVRRKEPLEVACPESNEFLDTQAGHVVPNSWINSGDLFQLHSFDGSNFKMRGITDKDPKSTLIKCRTVYVKEEQLYKVADIYYKTIPIDRMVVKSCLVFLDKSIEIETNNEGAPNEVYVNYWKSENQCQRRKYEVSVQEVDGDYALRHVTVKRLQPQASSCSKMRRSWLWYRLVHGANYE